MPADPTAGSVGWAEPLLFVLSEFMVGRGRRRSDRGGTGFTAASRRRTCSWSLPENVPPGDAGSSPQISGRDVAYVEGGQRIAFAIGSDGGVLGGASWIVAVTLKEPGSRAMLDNILLSIKVEREGGRHWAVRSFGRTFLASELPFELAEAPERGDEGRITRYESSFDGMDVTATTQVPTRAWHLSRRNLFRTS